MATGALVAFTALSAGASLVKGIQSNSAMTDQGIAYMKQAQIAQQESQYEAQQKQLEVDKAAASQVMAFAKNGVITSAGSPLDTLHETIRLGQQEVTAIRNSGMAKYELYQANAKTSFNSGRASLFGGITDALTSTASTIMTAKLYGLDRGKGKATT